QRLEPFSANQLASLHERWSGSRESLQCLARPLWPERDYRIYYRLRFGRERIRGSSSLAVISANPGDGNWRCPAGLRFFVSQRGLGCRLALLGRATTHQEPLCGVAAARLCSVPGRFPALVFFLSRRRFY